MKARRLLDVTAAAAYLDFPSVTAFRSFLQRRRTQGRPVRTYHRGRSLRFTEADLDAALDVEEARPLRSLKAVGQ